MRGLDARTEDPFQDRAGNELRAVNAAHLARRAMHADQLAQDFDDAATACRSDDVDGQAFPSELVDDCQTLELLTE